MGKVKDGKFLLVKMGLFGPEIRLVQDLSAVKKAVEGLETAEYRLFRASENEKIARCDLAGRIVNV